MENTKTFDITCVCKASYKSHIQVPAHFTKEQAMRYAKEHLDNISIESELEFVNDTGELVEEGCCFVNGQKEGDNMIKDAEYTSVWDGGIEITTSCKVNTKTKEVFGIGTVNVDGLDVLDEEYVTIDGKSHPVSEKGEREGNGYWYVF